MDTTPGSAPAPPTDVADLGLAHLYAAQRTAMVRLARLLTGSSAVSEDVVHEAFARILRRGVTVDHPEAYLRATVVNLSRDQVRRRHLERRSAPRDPLVAVPPEIDEMWAAVCRLPYGQRAVLVLRYYADLSEADIADALGCRVGTVKSRLHRGLARLRKELPS